MIKLKETTMRKTWVVCLLAMVCCALWGSAFPCIKVGYRLFQIDSADTATQILFAGCRFTIAGIMVILFGSILQGRFLKAGKGDLPRIGKICLLQTVVQYFFFYVGLAHTTGVKGSIVEASNVFLAILVSSLIFHQEKLDQKKVLGCIVGFAGVVLINLSGSNVDMSFNLTGDGFIFISAIAYALSSVLIKKYSAKSDPVMLSGYQFTAGGLVMILIGFVMGGRIHTASMPGNDSSDLYGADFCSCIHTVGNPVEIQSGIQGIDLRIYESGIWGDPFRNHFA